MISFKNKLHTAYGFVYVLIQRLRFYLLFPENH